jgi:predicted transposase YbfD/YdcC
LEPSVVIPLSQHFASLEDPRVERTKLHPLLSIVTIAMCAVIAGADTWDEIAEFGRAKAAWFATFLDLPHDIPSHDTFNRVFAALNPEQFKAGFISWMEAVSSVLPAQVIALDGKTVRRSHNRSAGKKAIHMVTAWASANRLVLAQVKVDDKSNEITALPELLRQLALTGCIVTIDAMGCQREIAKQIIDQDGDYVLALKENQGSLYQDVQDSFTQAQADQFEQVAHDQAQTVGKGHGRIEIRRHLVITEGEYLSWLQSRHKWPGLKAIGMVEAERHLATECSIEMRYYVLSRPLTAKVFGEAVRSHWGIENQVHWVLDMAFREDESRIRQGMAAENFVVLRHIALNLLKQTQGKYLSTKAKRLKAGWDNDYLLQVLRGI